MGKKEFRKNKILIFVVAYNAEKTIQQVLKRINLDTQQNQVEILIIDDASQDLTFEEAIHFQNTNPGIILTILKNPVNQGYGGNQKLGYQYAIIHQHDLVVLLHGDGQYAPEIIPQLITPILDKSADAVLGSRMLVKGNARKGGMPLYKFIGNKILSYLQNKLLRKKLSEYHSGFRVYAVPILKKIPFEYNSNDFHFDTQIIIQLIECQARIKELPIPTYYGDEICYVNGIKYAFQVLKETIGYRLHQMGIFFKLPYDIPSENKLYSQKLEYLSPHSLAIKKIKDESVVFDIGCGPYTELAEHLSHKKRCQIHLIDEVLPERRENSWHFYQLNLDVDPLPNEIQIADYVLLLDILEHLKNPEKFLLELRKKCKSQAIILISVPNVAFWITRFMLLVGKFNYGKAGILDKTHIRLFTHRSLKKILLETGYQINKTYGIPPPFAKALGNSCLIKILFAINRFFIYFFKGLFSYQFFSEANSLPTVEHLLKKTIAFSKEKRKNTGISPNNK